MTNCPAHFYRYRSLAGDSAEYVRKTLVDSQLYFAKPATFNDPLDCCPIYDLDGSDGEIIAYYSRAFRRLFPHFNDQEVLQHAHAQLHDPSLSPRNPANIRVFESNHALTITEKIGVLCLSEVRDDILMWSHYADFHRGICPEFDGYIEFFARAHKVLYRRDRPKLNPFRNSTDEKMEIALLAKAKQWSYEKEWRLIHYKGGSGVYEFPSEALTGVILGARISLRDEEKVRTWIGARKTAIKVVRASISKADYALNIS